MALLSGLGQSRIDHGLLGHGVPGEQGAQLLLRASTRLGRRGGLSLGERLIDLLVVIEHLGQPVARLGGGAGLGMGLSALFVADGRG